MKNLRTSRESGQATTEMAVMLLGFAFLMVGLILSMSMGIFNTRVLLEARHRADVAAGQTVDGGAGREISRWEYKNGIPFSLADDPVYTLGTEVVEAHGQLGVDRYSHSGGSYTYEWVKIGEFPGRKLTHDFRDRELTAVAAANLIVKEGYGNSKMPLIGNKLPELYEAAAKLLKVKISKDSLLNNPSNRVYMPANGEL